MCKVFVQIIKVTLLNLLKVFTDDFVLFKSIL